MKLSEFTNQLSGLSEIAFKLPNGQVGAGTFSCYRSWEN